MSDKTDHSKASDDLMDARINMTDPATDALIEVDPWTQAWEEKAEKAKDTNKAPINQRHQ